MSGKVKILFLAANPKDSSQLRLDQEIREIQGRIQGAEFRTGFDIVSRWAVRPLDLLQALNEEKPCIVHFSGHGSRRAELFFEADDGAGKPVSEAAMTSLFKGVKDNIHLVVFNTCHSQAQAISQHIECTVGMSVAIGDAAAIVFASMFYGALAFGQSVGQAFEQGRTALMLEGIPEEDTPVLLTRPGVDPLALSFVSNTPAKLESPLQEASLSNEAKLVIKEAAGGDGHVMMLVSTGGFHMQAGGKQLCQPRDRRTEAAFRAAVANLVKRGHLEEIGHKGEIFQLTATGYALADELQAESGS